MIDSLHELEAATVSSAGSTPARESDSPLESGKERELPAVSRGDSQASSGNVKQGEAYGSELPASLLSIYQKALDRVVWADMDQVLGFLKSRRGEVFELGDIEGELEIESNNRAFLEKLKVAGYVEEVRYVEARDLDVENPNEVYRSRV